MDARQQPKISSFGRQVSEGNTATRMNESKNRRSMHGKNQSRVSGMDINLTEEDMETHDIPKLT